MSKPKREEDSGETFYQARYNGINSRRRPRNRRMPGSETDSWHPEAITTFDSDDIALDKLKDDPELTPDERRIIIAAALNHFNR